MKKQIGIICLALALSSSHLASAETTKVVTKTKKKKTEIKSAFDWQWPDSRDKAVNSCSQYLSFMKPKMKQLSGEAKAHFKLHLDIAEALLQHLQAIQKKHGYRMDAKRCRSELIRAERLLSYANKKANKVKKA